MTRTIAEKFIKINGKSYPVLEQMNVRRLKHWELTLIYHWQRLGKERMVDAIESQKGGKFASELYVMIPALIRALVGDQAYLENADYIDDLYVEDMGSLLKEFADVLPGMTNDSITTE